MAYTIRVGGGWGKWMGGNFWNDTQLRESHMWQFDSPISPALLHSFRVLSVLQLHCPAAETDRPEGLESSWRGALHLHGARGAQSAAGLQPQTDAEDEERADAAG